MAAPIRAHSVEYAERTTRPRDAALRSAANDNVPRRPTESRGSTRATTDEIFRDSYAKQGLQPSVGQVGSFTRPKVEYARPSKDSFKDARPRETLREHPQVSTLLRQDPGKLIDEIVEEGEEFAEYLLSIASEKSKLRQVVGAALTAMAYIKVTRVNLMILSWTIWLWLWIQLPAALLSLGFLGIAASLDSLKTDFESNLLGKVVLWAAEFSANFANFVSKTFVGLDLTLFNPVNFFFLTHSVAFLVGISTLLIIGIIYVLSFLHPLFGKSGTALKTTTFIMAMCGCVFPFLNIFPWFLFWVLAVWRYPK